MKIRYIKCIYINVTVKEAVMHADDRSEKEKFILLCVYVMLFKRVRQECIFIIL